MTKRNFFISFLVAFSGIFAAVRAFELLKMIDPNNGFFYETYLNKSYIISAGFAVTALFFIIFSAIYCSSEHANSPLPLKSAALGISTLLYGGAVLVDIGKYFVNVTTNFSTSEAVLVIAKGIVAITFLVWSYARFTGSGFPQWVSILNVITTTYELIYRYTQFNGLSNVSENLIDILFMAFSLCFWLFHARICCNIRTRRTNFWCISFGAISVMFAAICTVPRIAVHFIDPKLLETHSLDAKFEGIGFMIYAIVFIATFLTANQKSTVDDSVYVDRGSESNGYSVFTPMTSKFSFDEEPQTNDEAEATFVAESEETEIQNETETVEKSQDNQEQTQITETVNKHRSVDSLSPEEINNANKPKPENKTDTQSSELFSKTSDEIIDDILNGKFE